jgi:hypothetical protein
MACAAGVGAHCPQALPPVKANQPFFDLFEFAAMPQTQTKKKATSALPQAKQQCIGCGSRIMEIQ